MAKYTLELNWPLLSALIDALPYLGERLYLLLDSTTHVDLIQIMRENERYQVSLDDALDMYGINVDELGWLRKPVTGSDMPSMGLELMSNRSNTELRDAV